MFNLDYFFILPTSRVLKKTSRMARVTTNQETVALCSLTSGRLGPGNVLTVFRCIRRKLIFIDHEASCSREIMHLVASVRRPFVCTLTDELFDSVHLLHGGRPWPWLGWLCTSRLLVKGQGQPWLNVFDFTVTSYLVLRSRSKVEVKFLAHSSQYGSIGQSQMRLNVFLTSLFVTNYLSFRSRSKVKVKVKGWGWISGA